MPFEECRFSHKHVGISQEKVVVAKTRLSATTLNLPKPPVDLSNESKNYGKKASMILHNNSKDFILDIYSIVHNILTVYSYP